MQAERVSIGKHLSIFIVANDREREKAYQPSSNFSYSGIKMGNITKLEVALSLVSTLAALSYTQCIFFALNDIYSRTLCS